MIVFFTYWVKYIILFKLFQLFLFALFNVAIRKFIITYVAHIIFSWGGAGLK